MASKKKIWERLRILDFDDLYILAMMRDNPTVKGRKIAATLHMSHSGLCHRFKKMRDLFGDDIFEKRKSGTSATLFLTRKGRRYALAASKALIALDSL